MTYIAIINTFASMKELIHTHRSAQGLEVQWLGMEQRRVLYAVRELVEVQFFLRDDEDGPPFIDPHDDPDDEYAGDSLDHPTEPDSVIASLHRCCVDLAHWVATQYPGSRLQHIVPVDEHGAVVLVLGND